MYLFDPRASFSYYSVMGYEKFIQSDSIRFNIIKEWYQEEAILDYWAEELRKILQKRLERDLQDFLFSPQCAYSGLGFPEILTLIRSMTMPFDC